MSQLQDYKLFHIFIDTYLPACFKGIDSSDPLMIQLEDRMERDNQFIYIADAIRMKILFTSKGSFPMIGIPPEDLSFYHFMEATHPSDIQRLNLGRTKVVKVAQDLFIAKDGYTLLSANY